MQQRTVSLNIQGIMEKTSSQLQDFSNSTSQLQDFSNSTSQLPDFSSSTTQLPDFSNLTSQLPDFSNLTTQLPDFSNLTSQLPDFSNLTSQLPDFSNFTSHVPDFSTPVVTFCSISDFTSCWLVLVCTILTLISLTGNAATFINILYRRKQKDVTYMCILLLAVSDFLTSATVYLGMFVLFPIMYNLYFNVPLCILFFWAMYTPFMWTGCNLVLLAYERYSLITNPLHYHSSHTSYRAVKISLALLVVMSLMSISYAVALSFIKVCPDYLYVVYYFAFIAVPLILIIIGLLLYLHCYKLVKLRKLPRMSMRAIEKRHFVELTIKVYLICLTYIFGQFPFLINDILVLLIEYNVLDSNDGLTYILFQIGTIAMLANYAINPFIYFLSFNQLCLFCKSKGKADKELTSTKTESSDNSLSYTTPPNKI